MVLAVGMINASCSLMHVIPDAILQFMGASGGTVGAFKETGRDAAGVVAGAGSILKGKGQFKSPSGGGKNGAGKA